MARTPIEDLLRLLEIDDPAWLRSLREEGLFEADQLEESEAEELRVAHCLTRQLGVNPAGVEVVLHMRRRMIVLQKRTEQSLRRLLDELDEG